jgi:hypothetical protein
MKRVLPLLAFTALSAPSALGLAGCGQVAQRYQAAQDIHAFFAAVESGDKAAFDAHIDRPALRKELRSGIGRAIGAKVGVSGEAADVLNDLLGSSSADQAMDRMISPESFRIVWQNSKIPIKTAPSAWQIAPMLKMVPPDQACLTKRPGSDDCVMTFRDEGGTWKLTGIEMGAAKPVLGPPQEPAA